MDAVYAPPLFALSSASITRWGLLLRYLLFSFFCLVGCALLPLPTAALRGQDPKPLSEEERPHFLPLASLQKDLGYLTSEECAGREAGTPGNQKARDYIKSRLQGMGLTPQEQAFPYGKKGEQGVNVFAPVVGKDPDAPWIIVSAHYDHLGVSKKKKTYYPGADDNASGVVVTLALAEHFSKAPLQHSLLFVFFDAEEGGLFGAKNFLKKEPFLKKWQIGFNLNLDMVGRSKKRELFAVSGEDPALRALLFSMQEQVGYKLLVTRDDRSFQALASDHYVFYQAKIPYVYLGVANHPDYHKVTDSAEKIEPTFFSAVADSCVTLLRALDSFVPMTPVSAPTSQAD